MAPVFTTKVETKMNVRALISHNIQFLATDANSEHISFYIRITDRTGSVKVESVNSVGGGGNIFLIF